MKTNIKKIFIITAALIFLSTGVSFGHDSRGRHHKPRLYGHGYYDRGYDYRPDRYVNNFHGYRHRWQGPRHHYYKKYYRHRNHHKPRHFRRHKEHGSYTVFHFSF